MNVGELFVTVESNIRTLQLSEEDIHCIANVHSLIFLHLLQLVKTFMMRDTESKENSYLIVPIKPGIYRNYFFIHTISDVSLVIYKLIRKCVNRKQICLYYMSYFGNLMRHRD